MLELVKQAKIGSIVPLYKEIDEEIDAFEYFAKLSNYGKRKNSIFLEDNGKSIGSANPCLVVTGKDNEFEIKALNNVGKRFLSFIKKDFKFCDKAIYHKDRIYGNLTPSRKSVSEQERLKLKTHMDLIREIAFKFQPTAKLMPYSGLFGIISYDFVNQIEDLPNNEQDLLKDPDYMLYFLDNMFIVNHKTKKTYFVANALVTDNKKEKVYDECSKTIKSYEKLIDKKAVKGKKFKKKELKLSYDVDKNGFLGIMKSLKGCIANSEILYAVPSRMAIANYNAEPLDIYAQLRNLENTFYINDEHGVFIGSKGKAIFNVNSEERIVKLRISTATRPRAILKDETEKDLDNKYEALLKVDEDEITYHTMLVDAIRDDVAKVSETGKRYVNKMFFVDKKVDCQNLVLSVKSVLDKDLDALHAYMATINFIAGFPKIKSMQLLRKLEKVKRCFGFGNLIYASPNGDLHSTIIEPIRLKKDKAYIRTGFRVFNHSNDEDEFSVGDKKSLKLLDAIKNAGGLK